MKPWRGLAADPQNLELKEELQVVSVKTKQLLSGRLWPTLMLVLGLSGFATLIGFASRRVTARTYTSLALFTVFTVAAFFLYLQRLL